MSYELMCLVLVWLDLIVEYLTTEYLRLKDRYDTIMFVFAKTD